MNSFKGKRVFISGGAGVIGRELIQLLVADDAIVMVGDLVAIPENYPTNIYYRRGDLNYITQQELDAFNPEYFFHLAATFERSTESYEHWEENFWHNIRLSNHLMTLMRNVKNIKRVVNCSSYLIYNKDLYNFDTPKEKPVKLKETDPINPRNLTGLAKLAHEIELDFLNQFKSDQFTSISARIYRGYGKNSRDVISRWIRSLMNNEVITVYKPEGWFDYMYAGDTAKGLYKLALSEAEGIVNLGTGRSRQVKDVLDVLRNHFPKLEAKYEDIDIKYEASEADTTLLNSLINWLPERYLEDVVPELIHFEKNRNQINEKPLGNVLVTSISKKIPLLENLKKSVQKINSKIKVIGADLDENCIGKYFVDKFWKMPRISELKPETLIQFCHENNISLIIPSRDGELEFFSKNKRLLEKNNISVMVSDQESVRICIDKLAFSNLTSEISAIPAFENVNDCSNNRVVVKERFGAGSLSIGINLDHARAIEHAKNLENPIFQPYITGDEISIDAYINKQGKVHGLVMRKRDLIVNGESQITTTFHDKILEEKFVRIIERLKLYGHVVLQAFIDKNSEVYVIECNSRFGGASTLSIHAGLDSFYWAYLESIDENLERYPFFPAQKSIKQIRHSFDSYQ